MQNIEGQVLATYTLACSKRSDSGDWTPGTGYLYANYTSLVRLRWRHVHRCTQRRNRPKKKFSLPAACRLFSRGMIFKRARVSLALLSLRTNGGLLVIYSATYKAVKSSVKWDALTNFHLSRFSIFALIYLKLLVQIASLFSVKYFNLPSKVINKSISWSKKRPQKQSKQRWSSFSVDDVITLRTPRDI